MSSDIRLIEDYLPIEAISAEASREKSVRKGHISTLHLWWARRPLVACRAAVYGALVPADRWVKDVELKNPPADEAKAEAKKNGKKRGLNRKAAGEFVERLCKYPGDSRAIQQAQEHILEAHAERLTVELAEGHKTGKMPAWVAEFKFTGDEVTIQDIEAGRAPRPRVLDMFAGGGAIPLEALRLGCEAYALDLNPVAHIIELCTLVYPQKYGRPDPSARGMTGPTNAKDETTWGGLANEVQYWGHWVLEKVRAEIGDLYAPIPDPKAGKIRKTLKSPQLEFGGAEFDKPGQQPLSTETPVGYLTPVAYLWTRTVRCKNPRCGATVPLVGRTWMRKKDAECIALKIVAPKGKKAVRFEVVEAPTAQALGFDPSDLSSAGNATCPFCGTVADSDYVKGEGCADRVGTQAMAVICVRPHAQGKVYVAVSDATDLPHPDAIDARLRSLCRSTGLSTPDEPIERRMTGGSCLPYGLTDFGKLSTPRQKLYLLTLASKITEAETAMRHSGLAQGMVLAATTFLCILCDRQVDYCSNLCIWEPGGEFIKSTFSRQALTMVPDFAELAPFGMGSGSPDGAIEWIVSVIGELSGTGVPATVERGSATALPWSPRLVDAVVTDPPYYDNVDYAKIADFFYVWLKRTAGRLYPEHFATTATPKKNEVVADPVRHEGSRQRAKEFYEQSMAGAFAQAGSVLKDTGVLVVVYAHKTTLGWATLVESLRQADFMVVEAWPLDTERPGRVISLQTAALASSIFLVARKRDGQTRTGSYEDVVQPELAQIVREKVDVLWEMGIAGSDLVIAAVGAGLRAFTKYDKVEYANGEEVPAEKFLAEVEGVVLDAMMGKLVGATGGNVSAVDPASRFYTLWRYVYKTAEIDAGEAIVFTYSQHVELDGPQGLSVGKDALVKKTKAKYAALDYTQRGEYERLGLPTDNGQPAPLIDVLHRVLWLMDNAPRKLVEYLYEAKPDRERLRVLAQALAGAGLSGKSEKDAGKLISTTPAEQAALGKLLANWKSLIPDSLYDARHTK